MSRKKQNAGDAAARTRKDTIVSVTMPYTTRVLLDMMCDFRGLNRSEYFRYLVLEDAVKRETVDKILAEATAEGVKAAMGRPVEKDSTISAFAVEEEESRKALLNQYPIFDDAVAWMQLFDEDAQGNRHFTTEQGSYTLAEFVNLDLKTMSILIGQKLNKKASK